MTPIHDRADLNAPACSRMCGECRMEVHDITLMDSAEAEEFLAERMGDQKPKLLLYRRPDGRVIENECERGASERRRLRAVYACAAIGVVIAMHIFMR